MQQNNSSKLLTIGFLHLINTEENNCLKTMYNLDLNDLLCTLWIYAAKIIFLTQSSIPWWQMNLFRLKAVYIYNSLVCFITSFIFRPLPFQFIALLFNPTDHFSSMLIFKNKIQGNFEENKELSQINSG